MRKGGEGGKEWRGRKRMGRERTEMKGKEETQTKSMATTLT